MLFWGVFSFHGSDVDDKAALTLEQDAQDGLDGCAGERKVKMN